MRKRVRAFATACGAGVGRCADIDVAISEAVTNAVVHGYRASARGHVHVEADFETGAIEVTISDDGGGFAAGHSPGLGLGLMLMRRYSTDLEIRDRQMGGVEVWMRFELG